jgi:regulator of nonsense transcripts 1
MVDEASQVEIGDYVPMLCRFASSLQKMVFIGDDRQCECFLDVHAVRLIV